MFDTLNPINIHLIMQHPLPYTVSEFQMPSNREESGRLRSYFDHSTSGKRDSSGNWFQISQTEKEIPNKRIISDRNKHTK